MEVVQLNRILKSLGVRSALKHHSCRTLQQWLVHCSTLLKLLVNGVKDAHSSVVCMYCIACVQGVNIPSVCVIIIKEPNLYTSHLLKYVDSCNISPTEFQHTSSTTSMCFLFHYLRRTILRGMSRCLRMYQDKR